MSGIENESTPPPQGLTETELKSIVGGEIDSRLETMKPQLAKLDKLDSFDLDVFRQGILEDVGKLFETNKSIPVDEAGMIAKIEGMFNDKFKALGSSGGVSNSGGSATQRAGGWLSRALGF
jgi:hypothetical protein